MANRLLAGALLVWLAVPIAAHAQQQAHAYQAELQRLEQHLADAYANLDWQVQVRKVDLRERHEQLSRALSAARSSSDARSQIERWVRNFNDPHLHTARTGSGDQRAAGVAPTRATSAGRACSQFRYRNRNLDFRLPFHQLPGAQSWPAAQSFPAALVPTANGRVGVIRIAHFAEDGYRSVCESVWPEFSAQLEGPCTFSCEMALRRRVGDALIARLEQQIAALKTAGAEMLVVDITGNGGGSNFVDRVARALSRQTLQPPRTGRVRHDHTSTGIRNDLDIVQRDLQRADLSDQERSALQFAVQRAQRQLAESERRCDRSVLWQNAVADCSGVFWLDSDTLRAPEIPPSLRRLPSGALLAESLDFDRDQVSWEGALVVLIDRATASASEYFASILRSNGVARVVGEKTMGAGCGFVDGGIPLELASLGLRIMAPNCIRLTHDRANELDGITPDVAVNWQKGDNARERAARVLEALARGPLESQRYDQLLMR